MEHPGVVAWLKRVYMVGDPSSSTAKSAVYDKYVRYCDRNGLTPTSAAAFGKLVHKAFPSVGTNRKGPRGDVRYHYRSLVRANDGSSDFGDGQILRANIDRRRGNEKKTRKRKNSGRKKTQAPRTGKRLRKVKKEEDEEDEEGGAKEKFCGQSTEQERESPGSTPKRRRSLRVQIKREKEERDKGGSFGREGDAVLRGLSADSEASGEDGSGDEDDVKLSSRTRNTKSRPKRKRKKDSDGDYWDHQRIRIKKERHVKREMKRRDDEERETEEQESIEEEQEREDEEQEEEEEQEDGERRIGIGGMMLAGGSVEDLQIHLDQNQSPSYLSIHNTTGTPASLEDEEEEDAVALGVGYPVLTAGSQQQQQQLPDYLGGNPYIVRKVPHFGGGTSSSSLLLEANSNNNSWSPNRLTNQRGLSGQPGVWQNFDFTPFLELKEDLDVSSTNQPVPIHQDSWSTSISVQAAHNPAFQSPALPRSIPASSEVLLRTRTTVETQLLAATTSSTSHSDASPEDRHNTAHLISCAINGQYWHLCQGIYMAFVEKKEEAVIKSLFTRLWEYLLRLLPDCSAEHGGNSVLKEVVSSCHRWLFNQLSLHIQTLSAQPLALYEKEYWQGILESLLATPFEESQSLAIRSLSTSSTSLLEDIVRDWRKFVQAVEELVLDSG